MLQVGLYVITVCQSYWLINDTMGVAPQISMKETVQLSSQVSIRPGENWEFKARSVRDRYFASEYRHCQSYTCPYLWRVPGARQSRYIQVRCDMD